MPRISRARRAELQHRAARIRQRGQRAGWDVAIIVEEIARQLPEVKPLEVWRFAYGWSRPQVVAAVLEVYRHQRAVDYYAVHYARYTPSILATEIHRCRMMVVDMLARDQRDRDRTELRRLAGWLSAQLGDLAFTLSDYAGAQIHLGTGARLGITVGDQRLAGWSLGAQSMVAFFGDRPADALDLAHQAGEYADTALHRAQITAWCELRALATLGRQHDARRAATAAQHHMDAAGSDEPGRFGFDRAELNQHLAEAFLRLGDTRAARLHANRSLELKSPGSGGWAAATVILARAHAAERNTAEATALATSVLDTVTRLAAGNHTTPSDRPGCRPAQRTSPRASLPRTA